MLRVYVVYDSGVCKRVRGPRAWLMAALVDVLLWAKRDELADTAVRATRVTAPPS